MVLLQRYSTLTIIITYNFPRRLIDWLYDRAISLFAPRQSRRVVPNKTRNDKLAFGRPVSVLLWWPDGVHKLCIVFANHEIVFGEFSTPAWQHSTAHASVRNPCRHARVRFIRVQSFPIAWRYIAVTLVVRPGSNPPADGTGRADVTKKNDSTVRYIFYRKA